MKKMLILLLTLILSFSFSACIDSSQSLPNNENVISPMLEGQQAVLTILLHPNDYYNINTNSFYRDYVYRFQKDFGITIKYEQIGDSTGSLIEGQDVADYMKKRSTQLGEGPELIFTQSMNLESLISKGMAVSLNDKIPNLKKVYSGLLENDITYVPISMKYGSKVLQLKALEVARLQIPGLDWTSNDRFMIRSTWLNQNKKYFNSSEWNAVSKALIDPAQVYNPVLKRVALNTSGIKKNIENAREYIYEDNSALDSSNRIANYYNLLLEENPAEFEESSQWFLENMKSDTIEAGVTENLLRAVNVEQKNKTHGTVMLPEVSDKKAFISTNGFVVNKNGKNLELAYEFINGLLSDEMQMKLYRDDSQSYYPVNKDIEGVILSEEIKNVKDPRVMNTKTYVLKQINSGNIRVDHASKLDFEVLKYGIKRELAMIIFADEPYTDVKVSAQLQNLEDKYNIFLSE